MGKNFLFTICLLIIIGGVSLLYPFGRDQGEYATIALENSRGKAVYRDIFNVKPPLTHLTHRLALAIFGQSMLAIRLFDLIWQGTTVFLIIILSDRIIKKPYIGFLAAFLYLTWYYSLGYWYTAQTDGFLTLLLLISLLAFISYQNKEKVWLVFVTGFAIGMAVMFKYSIGILIIFLLIMIFFRYRTKGYKAAFFLIIGFTAPIIISIFILAIQGSLDDFVSTQISYILKYNVLIGSERSLWNFLSLILFEPVILLSTISMFIFLVLITRKRFEYGVLIFLWWVAAFVHLVVQNKFYIYHAIPLLAPGAIMAGYIISIFYEKTNFTKIPRHFFLFVGTITLLFVSLLPWLKTNQKTMVEFLKADSKLADVYKQFGDYEKGDYSVRADMEAAAYLKSQTDENDTLFIWGFEPTVYFLAERSSASRFLYNFPLYGDFGWPELRVQLVEELEQNKPQYIVVVQNDPIPWVTGTENDSISALLEFPELYKLIAERYTFETQIEDFYLYRQKSTFKKDV